MHRKIMYLFGARSKKDLFFAGELFALEKLMPEGSNTEAYLCDPASND